MSSSEATQKDMSKFDKLYAYFLKFTVNIVTQWRLNIDPLFVLFKFCVASNFAQYKQPFIQSFADLFIIIICNHHEQAFEQTVEWLVKWNAFKLVWRLPNYLRDLTKHLWNNLSAWISDESWINLQNSSNVYG